MLAFGFEPKRKDIQNIMSDGGDDGSGKLGYEDFLMMMTHQMLNRGLEDDILMAAVRLFDDDDGAGPWFGSIGVRFIVTPLGRSSIGEIVTA